MILYMISFYHNCNNIEKSQNLKLEQLFTMKSYHKYFIDVYNNTALQFNCL